MKISGHAFLNR